ncbi:MAG: PH domain-containing protein [Blautia sp.]
MAHSRLGMRKKPERKTVEKMKFKGKTGILFWVLLAALEGLWIYAFFHIPQEMLVWPKLLLLAAINLLYLPMGICNYVLVDGNTLKYRIGIYCQTLKVNGITGIYRTNMIFGTPALAWNKIYIKSGEQGIICAIKEEKKLAEVLRARIPDLEVRL